MKNRFILSLLFLLISLLVAQTFAQTDSQLKKLYSDKQYFDLRDEVAKRGDNNSSELIFYRGAVANKFNQLQKSISLLESYVKSSKDETDNNLPDAYELLADDYLKTYQYRKAAEHYKIILDKYKGELAADEAKEIENSYGLFSALSDVPPQTIAFNGDTRLQATRDKARLMNVPVEINNQKMDFVFDTGANLSTVTASTAKKLGLKIIEANISVGATTDKKIDSKLGVAAQMKIGQMTLKNVVFLVMEDSALSFPQISYQINGIVGFPVIEAFRKVTITKNDEVLVAAQKSVNNSEQNMCLDELNPVILGKYNDRKMAFTLDTGAQSSSFYPAFFKAEEAQIKKIATLQNIKMGGAGGYKEISAYILESPVLNVSGKQVALRKVEVLTEPLNNDSRYFYGNLGQDLIKQFAKMTLNFESMSIVFE